MTIGAFNNPDTPHPLNPKMPVPISLLDHSLPFNPFSLEPVVVTFEKL